MVQGVVIRERVEKWKIVSPEEYRFYEMIVPGREDCQAAAIYRLNLAAGQRCESMLGGEEMNGVCIKGEARLELAGRHYHCGRFDSFYTAGGSSMAIKAEADCVFYIGVSVNEDYGTPFFRTFGPRPSLGEIHQIRGKGVGQREAFMILNQEIQASRLVAGLIRGGSGAWTSWSSHQHEAGLEEIYYYFDTDEPHFGLYLSYTAPGDVDSIVAYPVKNESMALAPRGYHPAAASPGTRNAYFWVLTVHSHESRSYNLAVLNPRREQMN